MRGTMMRGRPARERTRRTPRVRSACAASSRAKRYARILALASFGLFAVARAEDEPTGFDVTLHDSQVFRLRDGEGVESVRDRGQRAARTLAELVETTLPEQVAPRGAGPRCRVVAGETTVVELDQRDAELAGAANCEALAGAIAERVRQAFKREQQRSRVANTVFSASLVVFFGLVTLYLLRKLFDFSARSRRFLVDHPQRVPALRLQRLEVLGPAALRSVLLFLLSLGQGLGMFGLAYTWLVLSLSLFVRTRPYVEQLTGIVLSPLSALVARLATALPLFVVVLIAVALVAVIVRIAELFFASVSRGETRLSWLAPELAQATSTLVRIGLVIFAMVFAAPVITGDANGSLTRTGSIVVLAVALASTPLLASMVAGIALAFSRTLRLGDRVEYGGRTGSVRDIGVLALTLEEEDGSLVRVPHARSLWHPTRVFARGAP